MSEIKTRVEKLSDMSSTAFEHPLDRTALNRLRSITGFDTALRKIIGAFGERKLRMLFLANGIRINERQFGDIHSKLLKVCTFFDLKEIPEVYLTESATPNAMAIGVERPFIVLHSSLIQRLSEKELELVLAHEVGHILAGHALYKTMMIILTQVLAWIAPGPLSFLSLPILLALKEWDRKAELTADRAGLLYSQELTESLSVLMKLSGANHVEKINMDEFETQAKEYKEDGSFADNVFKVLNLIWMSHPFPVQRVLEAKSWFHSEAYSKILQGTYPLRSEDSETDFKEDLKATTSAYKENMTDLLSGVNQVKEGLSQAFFRKKSSGS
jgi:Zn-dependent protease with chaperone function